MSRPDRLFGPGAASRGATGAHEQTMQTEEGRADRIATLRAYLAHGIRTDNASLRRDAEKQLLALGVTP